MSGTQSPKEAIAHLLQGKAQEQQNAVNDVWNTSYKIQTKAAQRLYMALYYSLRSNTSKSRQDINASIDMDGACFVNMKPVENSTFNKSDNMSDKSDDALMTSMMRMHAVAMSIGSKQGRLVENPLPIPSARRERRDDARRGRQPVRPRDRMPRRLRRVACRSRGHTRIVRCRE
jgi:hypothetical protein